MNQFLNSILIFLFPFSVNAESPPAQGSGSMIPTLIFPLLLLLIFYFFLIRPQNKKNKELNTMISKLIVGDEVVTMTGMYGIITSIDGQVVKLKISKGVVIQLQKHTIISPLPKGTVDLS
ncbi:MAG: preprotein translocase subunit YajC [Methylacidiphilales bacterium]|nr:preprotein translocase subunit YajC [Candidatus Methylacidiphilales bacterium]